MEIYPFLDQHSIRYHRYEHPPVYTCEQAEELVPEMAAAKTKNLFLRDRKGKRHFLVVVGYEKQVDLAALALELQVDRLVLGSAQRMLRLLGVEPGSVTILGLLHDNPPQVEVVFDLPIAQAASLRCHPLRNDATLSISQSDIRRFLEVTGHPLQQLDIPAKQK